MRNLKKFTSKQDLSPLDPFGRIRVSEPYSIFGTKLVDDKAPLFYDEVILGSGTSTHNTGESSVSMEVSSDGDAVIRETFMRFNYQPAKGQYIILTGVMGNPSPNTESKIGYFNTSTDSPYNANEDGLYFGQDGTNKYLAISKSGSTTKILQSSWNIDRMDGSKDTGNKSHIDINFDSNQIFYFAFEWLGVGVCEFGFIIDGVTIPCHKQNHANVEGLGTGAYMSSPNHSVRYEVRSTGGSHTTKQICAAVLSEGGSEPSGVTRSFGNEITEVDITSTLTGTLFFRINENRPCTVIDLNSIEILNTASRTDDFQYKIILNPTIAGTTPSYTNITNSAIDYAAGVANNAITGGTVLLEGYASGNLPSANIPSNLIIRAGQAIDGTQDVLAICIRILTVGTDTFLTSMNVRELSCG